MKTRTFKHRRQRGVALIIGLILLMIITLLAVVGMNISNSELASATSEQLRLRAFAAAETGVERGLQGINTVGTASSTPVVGPVTAVRDSPLNPTNGLAQDYYQVTSQYRGEGGFIPLNSRNFKAFHYTVVSTGTSARNAVAVNTAGAFIVSSVEY